MRWPRVALNQARYPADRHLLRATAACRTTRTDRPRRPREDRLLTERIAASRFQSPHVDVVGGQPVEQSGLVVGHLAGELAVVPEAVPDARLVDDLVHQPTVVRR